VIGAKFTHDMPRPLLTRPRSSPEDSHRRKRASIGSQPQGGRRTTAETQQIATRTRDRHGFPPAPFLDQTGTENGPRPSVHVHSAKVYVARVIPVKRVTDAIEALDADRVLHVLNTQAQVHRTLSLSLHRLGREADNFA
jgi:hypothetical protein